MLRLVCPDESLEEEVIAFNNEFNENNERIVPYSSGLRGLSYQEWLNRCRCNEKAETCPPELVPANTYFLMNEDRILGAIDIRHKLNDYLLNFGGHIGYGIRPSERKKGYATKMLSLAIPIVKELGLDQVLITCDKTNLGSAKTIINNGGILQNEVIEDGRITQRYWINIK